MSAMSDLDIEVNQALDKYVEYMNYNPHYKRLRREFIDAAVELLEKLTGRSVKDELA